MKRRWIAVSVFLSAILIFAIFSFFATVTAVEKTPATSADESIATVEIVSDESYSPFIQNGTFGFAQNQNDTILITRTLASLNRNDPDNVMYYELYGSVSDAEFMNGTVLVAFDSDQTNTFYFLLLISFIVSALLSIIPLKRGLSRNVVHEPVERYLISGGHIAVSVLLCLINTEIINSTYPFFGASDADFVNSGLILALAYIAASSFLISLLTLKSGRTGYTLYVHLFSIFAASVFYILGIINGNPGLYGMNIIYIPVLLFLSALLILVLMFRPSHGSRDAAGDREDEKTIHHNVDGGTGEFIPVFPRELYGKYNNLSVAGTGGAAIVFKAERKKDRKTIALKVPIGSDEITGKSFIREISVWKKLKHKNIVEIYSANIFPVPYIEMEYLGKNLTALKTPLPPSKALSLITGIAEGLEYAHDMGVVHHDIKPGNILLDDEDTPKITDWGLSKTVADNFESSNVGFSLVYAAPEQLFPSKFGRPGRMTDIYQAGVLFYELMTGKKPLAGDIVEEIMKEDGECGTVPVSVFLGDSTLEEFDDIIMKCLKKKPEIRYENIGMLLSELRALEEKWRGKD